MRYVTLKVVRQGSNISKRMLSAIVMSLAGRTRETAIWCYSDGVSAEHWTPALLNPFDPSVRAGRTKFRRTSRSVRKLGRREAQKTESPSAPGAERPESAGNPDTPPDLETGERSTIFSVSESQSRIDITRVESRSWNPFLSTLVVASRKITVGSV